MGIPNSVQDFPPKRIIGMIKFYALPHCIPFFSSQVPDKSKAYDQ